MPEPDRANGGSPEAPPRLPARKILDGFRDLGVRDDPTEKLACEPSFNRYTAFWVLGETLDAGYAALEGMLLACPREARAVINGIRPAVLSYLAGRFDPMCGRFATDSSGRTRGLFATHAAIGVMRSLEGLESNQRLGREGFGQYLRAIGAEVACEGPEGIEALLAGCRAGDGVVENPEKPLIPTLTALYTASSILWYLGEDQSEKLGLTRFLEQHRLERFLFGCLKRHVVDGQWVSGFTIHPDHSELCVNTTFFGLRLMDRLGVSREARCDKEIERFLTLSHKDGGFSSTRWEPRSLNATYWGLRALKIVAPPTRWTDFLSRHRRSIGSFVASCRNPHNAGAPFAPDLARYGENCLATRYWLQIMRLLGVDLDDGERKRIFEFFRQRFDPATGGFRAYPGERVALDGFAAPELEQFLDGKDERLLAHHRQNTEGLKRPPFFSPDTHTIELYDRLVELEAAKGRSEGDTGAIEEQVEQTWRELRARQEVQAARYESVFDEEVLAPLRRGLLEIEEIEARLANR
jgi:hypothetical protein